MFENYRDTIESLLKNVGGYAEIRLERASALSFVVKNGIVENFSRKNDAGGFVRVLLHNHGWGIATFNDYASLPKAFADACDSSRIIIPDEPIRIAESDPIETHVETKMIDPFDSHSAETKIALCREYNEIMKSTGEEIILAINNYADWCNEKFFANTFGGRIEHVVRDGVLYCAARARRGSDTQAWTQGWSTKHRFSDFAQRQAQARETAEMALRLLSAKSVTGGTYTVVLDPKLAGVFIHEAFGHLSESDFILENPQAQQMMNLGRVFGKDFLNVIDDGTIQPDLHGTIHYDDEGIVAHKTYLIREGVLAGRLHNRETAAKLGEQPTGNARAQSYRNEPIVRMTNTAIEAGPHDVKKMFAEVKNGLYCTDAYGGQTQLENFSFSAGAAYIIEDGKPGELVRDVVLQGNLFQTLENIDAVGTDFSWAKWGGNCGKGGQAAPVDVGAPHIRIHNVKVGGKE